MMSTGEAQRRWWDEHVWGPFGAMLVDLVASAAAERWRCVFARTWYVDP